VWLLWLAVCATADRSNASPEFVVIVNAKNPERGAARSFVSDAFLKKSTRWKDGEAIRPVDQKASSGVRKAFSKAVLKRSVAAVRNYWQQKIFSGRGVPPPELESDEAVVAYVEKHVGAVGYVGSSTKLRSARPLEIR
jgi:ABC-type phosphate transport system substrate-binding protein